MIPIAKPHVADEEKDALAAVVDSGRLAMGPLVAEFEERFAELVGARNAVAVSSGTASLFLALLAHGIGPGDEVITTPFTFIATAHAILMTGVRPVFADIDATTFNLDPEAAEASIGPRTRAILPVHLFGHPVQLDPLRAIGDRHGLVVVQDAAQAVGTSYRGRAIGGEGTACFSFYATKNLMCGEGGMVTTDRTDIAERIRLLRNHGMPRRYHHEILGFNLRMSDLHAAIGLCQLRRFADNQARRIRNAAYVQRTIRGLVTPSVAPDVVHAWHQYTLRVPPGAPWSRDALVESLAASGVGTGVFYPVPAHRQPSVVDAGCGGADLPVAEQAAQEVVSIPVHPGVSDADARHIVEELHRPCLDQAV